MNRDLSIKDELFRVFLSIGIIFPKFTIFFASR